MIYYVSTNGDDGNLGTKKAPFRTINHAAQIAVAGDTVKVEYEDDTVVVTITDADGNVSVLEEPYQYRIFHLLQHRSYM